MKIIESDFSHQILKFVQNPIGNIFFLKHIAVVEINEGVHFNDNNASQIIDELVAYYGEDEPYGVIANRVNNYSVDLLNTPTYREKAKNLYAYGVVAYDVSSKISAEMENNFSITGKVSFDNLFDAINKVYTKVKNHNQLALN